MGATARESIDASAKARSGLGHGTSADQSLPKSRFFVESDTGRAAFRDSLDRASASHPAGAAVEVKDAGFYTDPNSRLFLSGDKSAGAAVSQDVPARPVRSL